MNNAVNEALVRRLYTEVFATGDEAVARTVLADDYVVHHPMMDGGQGGVRETLAMIGMYRGMFPDLRYVVDEVITLRDRVGVRWTATGTAPGAPAPVVVNGIDVVRIAGARIAEAWVVSDVEKLAQR